MPLIEEIPDGEQTGDSVPVVWSSAKLSKDNFRGSNKLDVLAKEGISLLLSGRSSVNILLHPNNYRLNIFKNLTRCFRIFFMVQNNYF